MAFYHYTLGVKLPEIFASGYLRTSPIKPKYPEKPVVWLSTNATFELSAIKPAATRDGEIHFLGLDQLQTLGQGLFRFRYIETKDNAALPWGLVRTHAHLPTKVRKRLLNRAKECGADPKQWYATLQPISLADTVLQIRDTSGSWRDADEDDLVSIDNARVGLATADELGVKVPVGKFRPGAKFQK